MDNTHSLEIAYRNGMISQEQVCHAIASLPCYCLNALRPGEESCQETRKSKKLIEVTGKQHPALPNTDGLFSNVCIACPVFAPALQQIAAALPKR